MELQALMKLESASPLQMSRYHNTEKLDQETYDEYERRTWRERCNYLPDGRLCIPPMAFKKALENAASYLKQKIPGGRMSTYIQPFKSAVMVFDPIILPLKKEEARALWLHVPSDGKRGGTSRVPKCFPVVDEWKADLTIHVFDRRVTKEVLMEHVEAAGKFIGVGAFRPQNGGYFGRFSVVSVKWIGPWAPSKTKGSKAEAA